MDPKITEAFDAAPQEIKDLILSGEEERSAVEIGEKYNIHLDLLVHLKDSIVLVLLGIVKTEDFLSFIKTKLNLDNETALAIAKDLNVSIFQKVRIQLLGEEIAKDKVKKITLGADEESRKKALREQLVDKTKRESALVKSPLEKYNLIKKSNMNGSRSQLMEQIEVLESIPTSETVESRLKEIKEQLEIINSKPEEETTEVKDEAKEFFADMGNETAEVKARVASYSKAPTRYNVDPYRELVED